MTRDEAELCADMMDFGFSFDEAKKLSRSCSLDAAKKYWDLTGIIYERDLTGDETNSLHQVALEITGGCDV